MKIEQRGPSCHDCSFYNIILSFVKYSIVKALVLIDSPLCLPTFVWQKALNSEYLSLLGCDAVSLGI